METANWTPHPSKKLKEEEFRFGEKAGFWERYDTVAEKFDADMLGRLNENLDSLLIFAGLFSAVNSAFIVSVLEPLTPSPAARTNELLTLLVQNVANGVPVTQETLYPPPFEAHGRVVRINCFFFASLAMSLLAATGAVLAKQWLQYYERTGQTGSIRKQGIRRTEKFIGAEAWGLRRTVEALPALILMSLALFFIAMAQYLFTFSTAVAVTITVLGSMGAVYYTFTLLSAAIWPACPFQTALSTGLRRTYLHSYRSLLYVHQAGVLKCQAAVNNGALKSTLRRLRIQPLAVQKWLSNHVRTERMVKKPLTRDPAEFADDMLYARAVIWMMETAPERQNLLSIAENIPALSDLKAVQLITRSVACPSLIYQLDKALIALRRDRNETAAQNALILARAVSHLVLANPPPLRHLLHDTLYLLWSNSTPEWLTSPDLAVICAAIFHLLRDTRAHLETFHLVRITEQIDQGFSAHGSLSHSAAVTFLHHYCLFNVGISAVSKDVSADNEKTLVRGVSARKPMAFVDRINELLSMMSLPSSDPLITLAAIAVGETLQEYSVGSVSAPSDSWKWSDGGIAYLWSICDAKTSHQVGLDNVSQYWEDNTYSEVFTTLRRYVDYFRFLDNTHTCSTISIDLLSCQIQLLRRMSERPFRGDSPYEKSVLLSNLRGIAQLLDGSRSGRLPHWDDDALYALRSCKRELLQSLEDVVGPIAKPSRGRSIESLHPTTEAHEDEILTPIINLYAPMIETSSYIISYTHNASLVVRALGLHSSSIKSITLVMLRKALFMEVLKHHRGGEERSGTVVVATPKYQMSGVLLEAQSGAPLLDSFTFPMEGEGVDLGHLDWWLVVWLAGAVRENADWRAQVGGQRVAELFVPLMHRMVLHREQTGDVGAPEKMKALGVFFLEMWAARSNKADEAYWTSDEAVGAFATFVGVLSNGGGDVDAVNLLEPRPHLIGFHDHCYELTINHRHTFHYIEHALSVNPAAAVVCRLHPACAKLIERYATEDNAGVADNRSIEIEEGAREGALRVRAAQRHVEGLLRDDPNDEFSPLEWPPHECDTCLSKTHQVTKRKSTLEGRGFQLDQVNGGPLGRCTTATDLDLSLVLGS